MALRGKMTRTLLLAQLCVVAAIVLGGFGSWYRHRINLLREEYRQNYGEIEAPGQHWVLMATRLQCWVHLCLLDNASTDFRLRLLLRPERRRVLGWLSLLDPVVVGVGPGVSRLGILIGRHHPATGSTCIATRTGNLNGQSCRSRPLAFVDAGPVPSYPRCRSRGPHDGFCSIPSCAETVLYGQRCMARPRASARVLRSRRAKSRGWRTRGWQTECGAALADKRQAEKPPYMTAATGMGLRMKISLLTTRGWQSYRRSVRSSMLAATRVITAASCQGESVAATRSCSWVGPAAGPLHPLRSLGLPPG